MSACLSVRPVYVSIHAPARGATLPMIYCFAVCAFQSTRPRGARRGLPSEVIYHARFQSTRPRGARLASRANVVAVSVFQSTRPRGARHMSSLIASDPPRFQSTRPRGARRRFILLTDLTLAVSIHAPARGATADGSVKMRVPCVSIHAPARGATQGGEPDDTPSAVSIHAPARGATTIRRISFRRRRGFNPRAREGRDRTAFESAAPPPLFQSTRPRGARLYSILLP